jgi:hypothetical protein
MFLIVAELIERLNCLFIRLELTGLAELIYKPVKNLKILLFLLFEALVFIFITLFFKKLALLS